MLPTALPTFLAELPTLVYAVLDRDSQATADLAWFAFVAALWVVLIVMNQGGFDGSPKPSAIEARGPTGDAAPPKSRRSTL